MYVTEDTIRRALEGKFYYCPNSYAEELHRTTSRSAQEAARRREEIKARAEEEAAKMIAEGIPPIPIETPRQVITNLVDAISAAHRIRRDDLLSNSRHRRHVMARKHFAWFLRMNYGWSFYRIGQVISRDHSSTLYAIKTFDRAKYAQHVLDVDNAMKQD
jgi:chromosomal replication initiation ATPase DnaA